MSTLVAGASTRRIAATAGLVGLVAAVAITGPLAQPSHAATYSASDSDSWETAVDDALNNTGETNTITITDDFTYELAAPPAYFFADHDLIVDGGGHTVTASATNDQGFLGAYDGAGSLTLRNLTLVGFESTRVLQLQTFGDIVLENITVTDFMGAHSAVSLDAISITISDSTFERNTSETSDGGAVYAEGPTEITDSVFTGNTAAYDGGAVYVDGGEAVTILNSTFTGNTATYDGGAVAGDDDVTIVDSIFVDNSNSNNESDGGGAVYADANADIANSVFRDNYSESDGGAVFAWFTTNVSDSTFARNEAAQDGGAVYVGEEDVTAYTSTFDSNTAGGNGGAVWGYDYADSFDSTWVGNSADDGGAIYSEGAYDYSYTWNSTFADNVASSEGGAFYGYTYYYEAYHSVFSGNSAGDDGAHIYLDDDEIFTYASVYLEASGGSDGCWAWDGATSNDYNFDEDGSCTGDWDGTGDIGDAGENPMLGELADNGGPTRTRMPASGSVLIDAIPTADCEITIDDESDLEFDQRGVARAQDDGCDIGSVEVLELTFTIATDNGDVEVSVINALAETCADWTSITGYTPTPPADVAFPFGVFDYCFTLPGDGWTVTIELDLPSPVNELWKDTNGTWSQVTDATIDGSTITYDITDGDDLDEDGTVNGAIIDPVAPGIGAGFTG